MITTIIIYLLGYIVCYYYIRRIRIKQNATHDWYNITYALAYALGSWLSLAGSFISNKYLSDGKIKSKPPKWL